MNKYASGYALVNIMSSVGWIVIAVSVIGGIFFASNAPSGMGWVGFLVALTGGLQGLLILGVGAIGTAILDGSVAQQKLAENFSVSSNIYVPETRRSIYERPESNNSSVMSISTSETRLVNSRNKAERTRDADALDGEYRGYKVLRSASGFFVLGFDEIFIDASEAQDFIDTLPKRD